MGLRLALLSTANINAKLVAGARGTDAVEIVAVGSRDLGRAQAHAAEHGIPRAHGSYEAVLADPEVDAVYVPLPNSLHVDWSIRALEAGKHVLCEKPLTRHASEAARAFDAAEAAGRVLAEAFMWRHHPQVRTLRELLPRIGELRLIRGAFSFPLDRAGDVRLDAGLEGGALMDVGCYCVSAARLLAGEPEAVAAHQVGEDVDIRLTASMRFPDGVLAHFDCAMDLPFRDELEVAGSDGALFMDDPWHSRSPVIELRAPDGAVETIAIEAADPYTCQLEDFAAACAGERPHPFGRDDAVGQARAIEMLYASAA
jgi:predicted dehydrogenase